MCGYIRILLVLFLLLFLTSAIIGAGPLARVARADVVSFAVVSLARSGGMGGMGGRWVVSFGVTLHKPWVAHGPVMNGFLFKMQFHVSGGRHIC